jgi:hypothetical protein
MLTLQQDDDGYYLVSDDRSIVFGEGTTPVEAFEDYTACLIEYYQLLESITSAAEGVFG